MALFCTGKVNKTQRCNKIPEKHSEIKAEETKGRNQIRVETYKDHFMLFFCFVFWSFPLFILFKVPSSVSDKCPTLFVLHVNMHSLQDSHRHNFTASSLSTHFQLVFISATAKEAKKEQNSYIRLFRVHSRSCCVSLTSAAGYKRIFFKTILSKNKYFQPKMSALFIFGS